MPPLNMRLYSILFRTFLKYRFDRRSPPLRPDGKIVPPSAAFQDGCASQDILIGEESGVSIRVFLPDAAIQEGEVHGFSWMASKLATRVHSETDRYSDPFRVSSSGEGERGGERLNREKEGHGLRGGGLDGENADNANGERENGGAASMDQGPKYAGYVPSKKADHNHKLQVIVQFHGGGFVAGSKDMPANDVFCRRIAKVLNAIVIAVGYRLAPEHKCPAAYCDGYEVLQWLARQAALINNDTSPETFASPKSRGAAELLRETARTLVHAEVIHPWLQMHADFSRVVLMGVSAGGNIADNVVRMACSPQGKAELASLTIAAQVLFYPLFGGAMPTPSEVHMATSSLFFDKATVELVFRLFLPESEYSLDHPSINPLAKGNEPPAGMPPTLVIVAEHDMLRDRLLAYVAMLRSAGFVAHSHDYKAMVHGFANLEASMSSPQAQGCIEDVALWVHRHLSRNRGIVAY
eukprot:TRINITY_DN35698_c0_g1_i1.p1 TRINITY_DN35698_c0_g1~~TRINITY_DN35698_c0_g1_i1.p1  ORF type:complete len:466 (-),score=53.94 TRINITY_DN35698_c0_g1_i1:50-1447(-)